MRIRFGIACFVFALGLLVVLPAPNLPLWIGTVIVTEWGYWMVPVMLGLLVAELYWGRGVFRLVTFTLCVAALVLFSLPFVEGLVVAAGLPARLSEALETGQTRRCRLRRFNSAACGGPGIRWGSRSGR